MSSIIILIICHLLSTFSWYKKNELKQINVTLVQPNIIPKKQITTKNVIKILNKYLNIIKLNKIKNSLIIFPESSIPNSIINRKTILNLFKKPITTNHNVLITGCINNYIKNSKTYSYNSILMITEKSHIQHTKIIYNKYHLVPFGEYIPFSFLFKYLFKIFLNISIKSLNKGSYIQFPISINNLYFSTSICYEIAFGNQIRNNFIPNVNYLISISNNAWFKNSIQPWQQFQIARMRALELGRPLLYSSNTGITAIINANGTIKNIIPQFQEKILNGNVNSTSGITPYYKYGNIPLILIEIYFILYIIINIDFKKR